MGHGSALALSDHRSDADAVRAKVLLPLRPLSFGAVYPRLENLSEGVATSSALSPFRAGSGAPVGRHRHAAFHAKQSSPSANDPLGSPADVLLRSTARRNTQTAPGGHRHRGDGFAYQRNQVLQVTACARLSIGG